MTEPAARADDPGSATRRARLLLHLRQKGVTDTNVLRAMETVPRELFVPASFRDQAYEDTALPIGQGQTISQPLVVGLMTQALDLDGEGRCRVLEVGTGSGYQAAVLARLCRRVYTIERQPALLREAEDRFSTLGLHNITTRHGDGIRGWPEVAPFDRILVTAGGGEGPMAALLDQLVEGGVLLAPLAIQGEDGMRVVRIRRTAGGFEREALWAVRFVPLLPEVVREEPAVRSA